MVGLTYIDLNLVYIEGSLFLAFKTSAFYEWEQTVLNRFSPQLY